MKTFFSQYKHHIPLIFIIFLAAYFRLYGINWDQGFHLHPDERAIVMFTTPLSFPHSWQEFFSPQSPLNPHFFAYGNFPLYLLKVVSSFAGIFDYLFTQYDKINLVGRILSAIIDLGTILVLYKLSKRLFSEPVALLASFLYALSVLPIQLSHFYAVDTLLTFFILRTLYQLVLYYEKPNVKNAVLIGIFFGLSLITKISAVVLLSSIGLTLFLDFFFVFLKAPHKPRHWFPHIPPILKRLFTHGLLLALTTAVVFAVLQPYALIDFTEFQNQNFQQYQMTHDAFIFPYTLQYVGKIPYVYELQNIIFFGTGPLVGILSVIGFYIFIEHVRKVDTYKKRCLSILASFFIVYFFIVGNFSIGFMRYMLPLYPLIALLAALTTVHVFKHIHNHYTRAFLSVCFFVGILIWPVSFLHIYTKPNTRTQATDWILQHIPPGATVAIEHWDDSLPLTNANRYTIITLPLYDPDSPEKWHMIHEKLIHTDYIIIASNRLYVPLQKLTDCQKLFPHPCYTETAHYYQSLFSGKLGFKKIKEFTEYPTIPLITIPLNDQAADESFTVYDHPKVMIFKKQ